jgi:hypothetical protein
MLQLDISAVLLLLNSGVFLYNVTKEKKMEQTCGGSGEFSSDAITPVIFSIQSFWSASVSACHQQS